MSRDDIRSRVAERIASAQAPLPTSRLGRPARWVTGLANGGAKSLGRSVSRLLGREESDVEPEAAIVASLGQLKGPMMKVGQMLGYVDVGLPDPLRSALSALHTKAPPLGLDHIHAVLDEDLGDPGRRLARALDPVPLSAASVGQVHRAALLDGTPVAVKVVHPGLSTIIERDFAPAMFASRIWPASHAMLHHVRERLLEECDYGLEARQQTRFREIFADHPTIVVPEVQAAYSSARVLTTTFVEGAHLDAFLATDPTPDVRNRVGEALFDFYVAPFFEHGVYNCDPHPGNYLFMRSGPDWRVAIVDFGCVREFDAGFVHRLASLTEAVLADDRDRMHDALGALGIDPRAQYDREAASRLLRAFCAPFAQDDVVAFDVSAAITVREALKSVWRVRRIVASGELLFLLRTFVGLSSVLARLGARANWRRRLQRAVAASPLAVASSTSAASPMAAASPTSVRSVRGPLPANTKPASWDVVLVEPGESRIALIRELREILGMDLRDLESLLDSVPETLKRALPRTDAEMLRQRLERAGARVEVRRA
jgi:predicted unusual protein kinase regulating ubiquinone biosynthesis (AarF/ABC1/UbiB family)